MYVYTSWEAVSDYCINGHFKSMLWNFGGRKLFYNNYWILFFIFQNSFLVLTGVTFFLPCYQHLKTWIGLWCHFLDILNLGIIWELPWYAVNCWLLIQDWCISWESVIFFNRLCFKIIVVIVRVSYDIIFLEAIAFFFFLYDLNHTSI